MRLRHDLVLIALPPAVDTTRSGILLAPSVPPLPTSGRVVKTGPACRDVAVGDTVAFPPNAGAVDWHIGAHRCVFLRETEISAVIPAREMA